MPSPTDLDTIMGAIRVIGLPENACITSAQQLIEALPQYLGVQVPASISNVVISAQQPGTDQTDSLWVRLTNNGGFVGLYVFAFGKWQQITPVPSEVFWITGDSEAPPDGYTLTSENPNLSTEQKNWLRQFWHSPSGDPAGPFDYFSVYFSGF